MGEESLAEDLINLILSRWSPAGLGLGLGRRRYLEVVDLHHCLFFERIVEDPRIQRCVSEGLVLLDTKERHSLAVHCGLPSLDVGVD